jgi:K(+)-stimulated pyrophosphate-energized sodium pump
MRRSTQRIATLGLLLSILILTIAPSISAAETGGEASLVLPDLSTQTYFGINARVLLMLGLLACLLGLAFGLYNYIRLKNLPVHKSMRDISELIYETCKTYLITQGKFLLLLEVFIGAVIVIYFGVLSNFAAIKVLVILLFSLIGDRKSVV